MFIYLIKMRKSFSFLCIVLFYILYSPFPFLVSLSIANTVVAPLGKVKGLEEHLSVSLSRSPLVSSNHLWKSTVPTSLRERRLQRTLLRHPDVISERGSQCCRPFPLIFTASWNLFGSCISQHSLCRRARSDDIREVDRESISTKKIFRESSGAIQ